MLRTENVIEWPDLISHAEKLGFAWNYAHDILRVFSGYDHALKIDCEEIEELEPLTDPYIGDWIKEESTKFDMNQMGRDIVYDFMQLHKINEMVIVDY